MSSDQAGLLLVVVVTVLLFTEVGRRWAARGAGWALWRAPKGAVKYGLDSNMALAGDIGRRIIVLVVYGAYLWGARWVWTKLDLPGRWVISVLLLLWFVYAVNVVSFIRHGRAQASRNRQLARQQYRVVHEIHTDVREALAGVGRQARDGGVDVLGKFRGPADPVTQERQRIARDQQVEVRSQLPEDVRETMPLGDRYEPMVKAPRWMRRQWRKEPKD